MSTDRASIQQERIAEIVSRQHGIPKNQVYFPYAGEPDRPWLGAGALMTIARKSVAVAFIGERYDKFEPALDQYFHIATLTLVDGHTIERTGVATRGEKLPGIPEDEEVDEHGLAAARAIRKVLADGGLDPFSSIQQPGAGDPGGSALAVEAARRKSDLARIHILAEAAGLITKVEGRKVATAYYAWLRKFGESLTPPREVRSAGELNEQERASVIGALDEMVKNPLILMEE